MSGSSIETVGVRSIPSEMETVVISEDDLFDMEMLDAVTVEGFLLINNPDVVDEPDEYRVVFPLGNAVEKLTSGTPVTFDTFTDDGYVALRLVPPPERFFGTSLDLDDEDDEDE